MGKSICSYTSLGNNTPRDIDKKFREIHKYLCYYQTSIPSQNGNSGKFLTTDGISLSWGNISSGSGLFPVTGTGTATGDVTGELDGNVLSVQQDGNDFLTLYPIAGGEHSALYAFSSETPGAQSTLFASSNNDDGYTVQFVAFDGTNEVSIIGNAAANTLALTAGAGIAQSAPASTTAAILQNGQISFYLDEVGNNLKVAVQYSDGTTKTATVALA